MSMSTSFIHSSIRFSFFGITYLNFVLVKCGRWEQPTTTADAAGGGGGGGGRPAISEDVVVVSHDVTNYEFFYEPFYAARDDAPPHDERFVG